MSGFLSLVRVILYTRQQEIGIFPKPLKLKPLSGKGSSQHIWAGISSQVPGWPTYLIGGPVLGGQKEPAGRTRWRSSPLPPCPQSCIEIHRQIEAGPWGGALTSWPRQVPGDQLAPTLLWTGQGWLGPACGSALSRKRTEPTSCSSTSIPLVGPHSAQDSKQGPHLHSFA